MADEAYELTGNSWFSILSISQFSHHNLARQNAQADADKMRDSLTYLGRS